jgi:hypothetical protein
MSIYALALYSTGRISSYNSQLLKINMHYFVADRIHYYSLLLLGVFISIKRCDPYFTLTTRIQEDLV